MFTKSISNRKCCYYVYLEYSLVPPINVYMVLERKLIKRGAYKPGSLDPLLGPITAVGYKASFLVVAIGSAAAASCTLCALGLAQSGNDRAGLHYCAFEGSATPNSSSIR